MDRWKLLVPKVTIATEKKILTKVRQEIRQDISLKWAYNSAWLAEASSSNVSSNFLAHFN